MPPYSLMDATKMTEAEAALMRARLHLRGGKHRLQTGSCAAGIAALYDSVLFGMRYYIAKHKRCSSFVEGADLWDAAALYHALARAGVFEDRNAFNHLSRIVEHALWKKDYLIGATATLPEVENMLTKLGVIPFAESALSDETLMIVTESKELNKN